MCFIFFLANQQQVDFIDPTELVVLICFNQPDFSTGLKASTSAVQDTARKLGDLRASQRQEDCLILMQRGEDVENHF